MDLPGIKYLFLSTATICSSSIEDKQFCINELNRTLSREDPTLETIDALVDISYYIYDTLLQFGHCQNQYAKAVIPFAARNFGINEKGEYNIPPESDISPERIQFLLKMVFSECLEGLYALDVPFQQQKNVPLDPNWVFWFKKIAQRCVEYCGEEIYAVAFAEVNNANLRKGYLVDGLYHFTTTDIGGVKKVIKPVGWVGPNLKKALEGMIV